MISIKSPWLEYVTPDVKKPLPFIFNEHNFLEHTAANTFQ
jgi:hypothetical protein